MSGSGRDHAARPSPPARRRLRRLLITAAAAGVLAVVVGLFVLLIWQPWSPQDLPELPRPSAGGPR